MARVVADTNVFLSAVMFGGLPGSFLDLAFLGAFQLVTSFALLDELDEKLLEKFRVAPADAGLIRARIEACALVTKPNILLNVVMDDPDDNRVLECAVTAEADYVVSGDRHLLKPGSYGGIAILTVRKFMDALKRKLVSNLTPEGNFIRTVAWRWLVTRSIFDGGVQKLDGVYWKGQVVRRVKVE